MGENSKIEWTHHTFNPWRGCTKVSQGCKHCYAETMSGRNPAVLGVWGRQGSRPVAAESYWRQPLKWDRDAQAAGERRRVFCSSLADVFEGRDTMPENAWAAVGAARFRLFHLIEATPWLDWLLLTKRPENAAVLAPERWSDQWPDNAWIGTSVEDQSAADARIPHLLNIPARVRFLSCESLLGLVDLSEWLDAGYESGGPAGWQGTSIDIHWVIAGGESGPNARPMHPTWVRSLRDQCHAAGVPFLFKQHGEWASTAATSINLPEETIGDPRVHWMHIDGDHWQIGKGSGDRVIADEIVMRVGKARAGRDLDGRTWDEFPEVQR